MIYILTGAIRSGKTTALRKWVVQREDVDGLICPDDVDGKRYFLKVRLHEEFQLEVESENKIESDKIIKIGPFQFLKSAFEKANKLLISFASEIENRYLILDELGKLELRNEGLHCSAEILIPEFIAEEKHHLILVVRDYLLNEIVKHYGISEYQILKKEDLSNLD